MRNKAIYKIIFEDGDIFNGGKSIKDSKWLVIPNKPIIRLEYFVSDGEGIILENFESYLCYVAANALVSNKIGNCPACNKKGKISKKIIKYSNNTTSDELIARCTKCNWVGKINELVSHVVSTDDKYIYIMGLKNGMVTSYRVSLIGKDGKDKYKTGDITKRVILLGKEDNGRPTNRSFWKRGIK